MVCGNKPTKIYHVCTKRHMNKYRGSGHIKKPVRGFNNITAAMAWALKTGRKIILEIDVSDMLSDVHKLPDHHNKWGEAWWIDRDVPLEKTKKAFHPGML